MDWLLVNSYNLINFEHGDEDYQIAKINLKFYIVKHFQEGLIEALNCFNVTNFLITIILLVCLNNLRCAWIEHRFSWNQELSVHIFIQSCRL